MWSGERLTKLQVTSRPDRLWPELWTKFGRNAKLREKQKWSIEKPKLDNTRRLWGIYFIELKDTELKETMKNACKKLETPVAPAMPSKISKKNKHGETRSKTNDFKSQFACIHENAYGRISTEITPWGSYCRKRRQFTAALQFGTQIYSCASSNENSRNKSSSG